VNNEMTAPKILTNCDFLVPVDRVCFGSATCKKQGLCETCTIYAEKKVKPFYTKKVGVFDAKKPSVSINGKIRIIQEACAVTVEAQL